MSSESGVLSYELKDNMNSSSGILPTWLLTRNSQLRTHNSKLRTSL